MKILMISHEYPPIGGGGANACLYLGKGIAEKGHDVTLVTANYRDMEAVSKENGIKIFRVNSKRKHKDHCSFGEMLSFLAKARPVVDKLQKQERFDICLVFFGIPSGVLGYYLKKKYKLPYVIRFGGGDIPGFQDRFTKVYKIIAPAIKSIWKNAEARIANSEGLKEMAYRFCDKYPFSVIPNGVDVRTYYPSNGEKADGTFIILFVSRLIERKGLQFIVPEIRRIIKSTSKEVHFYIVGDGPYRQELEQMVAQYKVDKYVTFLGHKDKNEIVPCYRQADLFILPSKKEGMPNVVLEAMACGLPIIMTPCEGSKELISGNGAVTEIESFVDCMIQYINDDKMRDHAANVSRQRAEEIFSWENTVKAYEELLSETD